MAQFDVHRYEGVRSGVRYVVDIQSDLLDGLATRVVVPLYRMGPRDVILTRLNP